ncbi:hypothetical protein B0H14DRAFT_2606873 [Mycena olivaceomarginata]|nr:hypothetical protein B0H14DRAFT_2606873 [Mycena olivaceomarginata]
MFSMSIFAVLLSTTGAVAAGTHGHWVISRREDSDFTLGKRYDDAEMTWYPTDTGADACTGKNHEDADFFVAVPSTVYTNKESCEKQIKITYSEKTAVATIVDLVSPVACSESHIDLTIDLCKNLTGGDLDVGSIYGSWSFIDNGDSDDGGNETSTATTTHHTLISTEISCCERGYSAFEWLDAFQN